MDVWVNISDPLHLAFQKGRSVPLEDGYELDRTTLFGTYLCGVAQVCESPPPHAPDALHLYLPKSEYTEQLRNHFLSISPEDEKQLNAILAREFETVFMSYITNARMQGLMLKDALWMFCEQYHLADITGGDTEMLKKRYYRRQVAGQKRVQERLRQMYHYRLRVITAGNNNS